MREGEDNRRGSIEDGRVDRDMKRVTGSVKKMESGGGGGRERGRGRRRRGRGRRMGEGEGRGGGGGWSGGMGSGRWRAGWSAVELENGRECLGKYGRTKTERKWRDGWMDGWMDREGGKGTK